MQSKQATKVVSSISFWISLACILAMLIEASCLLISNVVPDQIDSNKMLVPSIEAIAEVATGSRIPQPSMQHDNIMRADSTCSTLL